MDVINNYVQDEVLHEHCYNCKSLNSAFARKIVNHPSVISFFLKRYKGNLITNKCRNNSFSSQEKDLNKHITTNGSRLYKLSGIILHQGKNLTCGHYITVIIFDDEILKDRYIFIYETQNYISNLIDKWTPLAFLFCIPLHFIFLLYHYSLISGSHLQKHKSMNLSQFFSILFLVNSSDKYR